MNGTDSRRLLLFMWTVTAAATPLIALTAWQALTAASELRGQIVVVIAQSVALLIDWKVRGRLWHRLPFNIGQYALAFIASRAIYALVAGLPFTGSTMQGSPDLLAAIAAGAVFLLVNNGLVAVAVARDSAWLCGVCSPRTSPGSS